MKVIPTVNKRKIVVLEEVDIFFNESVGVLLTKRKAMNKVKYG